MITTTLRQSAPAAVPLVGTAEPTILVVDLGGSWSRFAVGGEPIDEELIAKHQTLPGYEDTVAQVGRAAAFLCEKKPDAIGFGIAGQMTDGTLTEGGKLKQFGWVGRPIASDIAAALNLDPSRVVGLNDVAAAAKAEQVATNRQGNTDTQAIYTLSTGFGGALFTPRSIIPDEPGHEYLRAGAQCACGRDGCLEAHVSGLGIAAKYGLGDAPLPPDDPRWSRVKGDLVAGVYSMLDRYAEDGHNPRRLSFFGSVALKGPDILGCLRDGLMGLRDDAPQVDTATYGDVSGLQGAYFAARETL